MSKRNLLVICADEHQRDFLGCYGHPVVKTPHLDALATRGARFSRAYTNAPICVPARAAIATGRYVHTTGHWDNAFPYHGEPESWGHALQRAGVRVESIGKLHYRSNEDDDGFLRKIDAMYVADGVGEITSCIRHVPQYREGATQIRSAGPGQSSYIEYDRRIARQAAEWLRTNGSGEPWCLFVSFVNPHPPFTAPREYFDIYRTASFPLPNEWERTEWPEHPVLTGFRRYFGWDGGFTEEEIMNVQRTYAAMCTFVDAMAGPRITPGATVATPVSLVDLFPTILDWSERSKAVSQGPGRSLFRIAAEPDSDRTVFSEYHAAGSTDGVFMAANATEKFIHYVGAPPQLFNLASDPEERVDLSSDPAYADRVADWDRRLRTIVDPEAVDRQAKADQAARVALFGGERAVLSRGRKNSAAPGDEATISFDHRSGG